MEQKQTKNICVLFIIYQRAVTYSKNNVLYFYVSCNSRTHDAVLIETENIN